MAYTMFRVCRKCGSFLQTHPTLHLWFKCPSCGYCKMSKEIITLETYLMGRDKLYPQEFTSDVVNNAKKLLDKVNNLLNELKIDKADVSSGWRPAAINSATKNAAKKSAHQIGQAVDIKDDKDQTLGKKISENPELLRKYGLWIEAITSTKGVNTNWVHLDIRDRVDRPSRMFNP
jgi:DNA-directed RNA polymerase subunit M/transcription elongation factor TFIIS